MATKTRGYNIILKIDNKLVAGTTENTFKIDAEIEESLIKEDLGVKELEHLGYESELTVTGLMMVKETGEASTHLDYSEARSMVTTGTTYAFVYGGTTTGDATVSGNLKITSINENTNSKDTGAWNLTCRVTGDLTFGTAA